MSEMFPGNAAEGGAPYFFKKAFHNDPLSLSLCPAGLMTVPRSPVTTNHSVFIINPAGT
jgi:hypothetical protein